MSQLDALALTESLRERMVGFALDDAFVRDVLLNRICRDLWSGPPEGGGLLSDLWVEGAFPAETVEESLQTLVDSGKFDAGLCQLLDRPDVVPRTRPLYSHQLAALLKASVPNSLPDERAGE